MQNDIKPMNKGGGQGEREKICDRKCSLLGWTTLVHKAQENLGNIWMSLINRSSISQGNNTIYIHNLNRHPKKNMRDWKGTSKLKLKLPFANPSCVSNLIYWFYFPQETFWSRPLTLEHNKSIMCRMATTEVEAIWSELERFKLSDAILRPLLNGIVLEACLLNPLLVEPSFIPLLKLKLGTENSHKNEIIYHIHSNYA